MSLRKQVLQSSTVMAARQALGLGVGAIGAVVMARMIGADDYGVAVAAIGLILFAVNAGRLGTGYYLVAQTEEPSTELYNYAFTLMLAVGVLLAASLFALLPLVYLWYDDFRFVQPLFVLIPVSILMVAVEPARALLERDLRYRELANVEMSGEILYLLCSVSLALLGFGFWAPAIGFVAGKSLTTLRVLHVSGLRPRFAVSRAAFSEILRYGAKISVSRTIGSLGMLVNPLIVGRLAGPSGVAYVNVAAKSIDVCLFLGNAAARVSFATFSRLQAERPRLRRAVEQAMVLVAIACGGPLVLAALIGAYPFSLLFGSEWLEAWELFPYLALAGLVTTVMGMPRSALMVIDHSVLVGVADAIELGTFMLAAFVLMPEFGLIGFAYARLVGFVGHALVIWSMHRHLELSIWPIVPWVAVFGCALFAAPDRSLWSLLLLAPLLLLVIVPGYRRRLLDYYSWGRELVDARFLRRPSRTVDALP